LNFHDGTLTVNGVGGVANMNTGVTRGTTLGICLSCLTILSNNGYVLSVDKVELPEKVTKFLLATEKEAAILVWDLNDKPQTDLVYARMEDPMVVGSMGRIDTFKVVHVIDDWNMLANVSRQLPTGYTANETCYKLDVITEEHVWISGSQTAGSQK